MLPVISQSQIYRGLQQGIPDTLFSPAPEPDIDRVPLAITLMHISPGTTDAQDMQHTTEKTGVYLRTDAKASNCWSRQARELQVCDGVAKKCGDMACPVSVTVSHAFVTVALNQSSEHEAVQGLNVDMTLFARFDRGFLEPGVGKTSDVKCSDNPLAL